MDRSGRDGEKKKGLADVGMFRSNLEIPINTGLTPRRKSWSACGAFGRGRPSRCGFRMEMTHLDQGPLGHERRKPATIATNLEGLQGLGLGEVGVVGELGTRQNGGLCGRRGWCE